MKAREVWLTMLKHGPDGPSQGVWVRRYGRHTRNSTENICSYYLHKTSAGSETSRHWMDFQTRNFWQRGESQASNARGDIQKKSVLASESRIRQRRSDKRLPASCMLDDNHPSCAGFVGCEKGNRANHTRTQTPQHHLGTEIKITRSLDETPLNIM